MVSNKDSIGVLGATSIIGECLLPQLVKEGYNVVAFTRQERIARKAEGGSIEWRRLPESESTAQNDRQNRQIKFWISLAPVTVLPEYFPMISACGAGHVVAVSSTSRFTKTQSSDREERELADDLAKAEQILAKWAKESDLTFTVLRPTLIYGLGCDKNISVIASLVQRFGFFCVLGDARGLRQPVHAHDVASACAAALNARAAINRCYNISGGDTIAYREMVCRIFSALGQKPRFLRIPLWIFRITIFVLHVFPRFKNWSAAMAQRMNQNLIFDHEEASRDLNFSPRKFYLAKEDLPAD